MCCIPFTIDYYMVGSEGGLWKIVAGTGESYLLIYHCGIAVLTYAVQKILTFCREVIWISSQLRNQTGHQRRGYHIQSCG